MRGLFRLHVVYEETAEVLRLRQELETARNELKALRKEHDILAARYGYEVAVNSELIDVCRAHGIRYRPGLDISKWDKELRQK